MKSSTNEIKETLESIRAAKCPDVASQIINRVVDIEFDNQERDSRAIGKAKVKETLQEYIDAVLTDEAE